MAKTKPWDGSFVIHKHEATQLHYDFRLAWGGVLKSWAVPKGPSLNPSDKRLAIEVEDHAREYADFEGSIPRGQYGAGTVMIWDRGHYRNLRGQLSMAQAYERGLLEFQLEGEKLAGGFALKRFRSGKKPQWLLIKMRDSHADARRHPTATENRSVKTGRSMEEIERDERPQSQ